MSIRLKISRNPLIKKSILLIAMLIPMLAVVTSFAIEGGPTFNWSSLTVSIGSYA
jgi:hypothetical protein